MRADRIAIALVLAIVGCRRPTFTAPPSTSAKIDSLPKVSVSGPAALIVAAAHKEADQGAAYTPGYFRISYPNGDLPPGQGVCTDVVIRALRGAGYDLQRLIHDDIVLHFHDYPRREPQPDSNIDHRRVPNQMFFFRKFGATLTNSADEKHADQWKPGDIVYWRIGGRLDHAGVVSDHIGPSGRLMVIHNMDRCQEEDVLAYWPIQGHFRYPLPPAP